MVFIIVVTHGQFGSELVKSAELIVGSIPDIAVFGLDHGDDVSELQSKIGECIAYKHKQGYQVLVMCDLLGGSPSNVAAANLMQHDFYCLTGLNLPMLVEAVDQRDGDACSLEKLAALCNEAGKNGIVSICRKGVCKNS